MLYSLIVAQSASCHTLSNAFFEVNEDVVEILLVLKVSLTQYPQVKDLLCGASSLAKTCLFFSNDFLCFRFHNNNNLISFHLGFVHPLQDVALHQCLPSSSVCCFPNPGGSLLLYYVVLPSSAWSSSRPLPPPWLPLCASLCPPIVL